MRAALYLRVSTARQAEHDVSIPDQKRQGEAYRAARGYQLVEIYVEPGASATNDRRPEFKRMIEAGTSKPAPFDIITVHSFSRFFRDHFELEFDVRKLAKNGVRLIPITQEMGDDPMHVMMRQIMALFDEYQSKENAKHVTRALKKTARQGETRCAGRSIPMGKLDSLVAEHLETRLLQPERLEEILASVLDRRQERAERRREHIAELNKRSVETDLRLKRLYDAIAATTFARSPSASRSRSARSASWDRSPGCFRRSWRTAT